MSYTDPQTGLRKNKKFYTPENDFDTALAKKDFYREQFLDELASQNRDKSRVIPLYKFIERFFAEEGGKRSIVTYKGYRQHCNRFMRYFDKNVPLHSISRNKATMYLKSISSKSSADAARRSLRAI